MTPSRAKELIAELGCSGTEFSMLLNKHWNYVSKFSRDGVPCNIAHILELSIELKRLGGDPISIIKEVIPKKG